MNLKNNRNQELNTKDLTFLGQYLIDALENPDYEIDLRSDMINTLKKEVTITRRLIENITQEDAELKKIASYFKRQKDIIDEVVLKPHLQQDIEFTTKFIISNQKRINEIINNNLE
jgi:hypothetical protein